METDQALFSLAGKVALITGSGRGLGLAMAIAMAQAGAKVYINGRNSNTLSEVANKYQQQGLNICPLAFDVEDEASVDAAFEQLSDGLDILVNNVGVRDRRGMFDLDIDDFRKLLDNHVVSAFSLGRRAAALMKAQGSGRIINMVSIAAYRAAPADPAYIAAKGSLAALTRAQASELGEFGITVNAIAPGAFTTETNEELAASEQGQQLIKTRSCLKRWGKPEEICGAAVFLASPSASYVTGHTLVVDGGVLANY